MNVNKIFASILFGCSLALFITLFVLMILAASRNDDVAIAFAIGMLISFAFCGFSVSQLIITCNNSVRIVVLELSLPSAGNKKASPACPAKVDV